MLVFTTQKPSNNICIVCIDEDGEIFVYARYKPRLYKFDLSQANEEEKEYLRKCIEVNKWLDK